MNELKKIFKKENLSFISSLLFGGFRLLLLLGISYIVLFPVLEIISTALTLPEDFLGGNVEWIPSDPTFTNFSNVLLYFDYVKHAWATVKISVGSTVIQLVVASLVGYGLARYRFKGNTIVFIAVIFTIIVPIQTIQIPAYIYYRHFDFFGFGRLGAIVTKEPYTVNLLNTSWSYYVPAMFGVGLNSGLFIFLFRQFFSGMPKDLEDAGRVDGCNPLMVFVRIMVPNVKPVFVTVALLSTIYYWNDFMLANMFMGAAKKTPLMMALYRLNSMNVGSMEVDTAQFIVEKHAALLMTIAPLMIVFLICQKFFVECMDRSGIKG